MKTFKSRPPTSAPHSRGTIALARRTGLALALGACFLSTHAAYAASSTGTFPGGATTPFSTAGISAGSTTADTITFTTSGTGTATGTDDISALSANILTFSNTIALLLNQGAGTSITLGGTTPTVNLNNTAALTDAVNTVLTSNTTTFQGSGSNATFSGNVTTSGISGAATLNLGSTTSTGTGNLLSGTLSDSGASGGLILNKQGTGTWTFGGNQTSMTGSTLAKGSITQSAGTLNFGSATDTPYLKINGNVGTNIGLGVTGAGSIFNMNAGTLAISGPIYGVYFGGPGTQTYNQTGGTLSTGNYLDFAATGGTSIVNISGGNLTTTFISELALRGTTTVNLSGTGVYTAPTLNMTNSEAQGTVGSTFNLGNGTVGGEHW